jgi:hypothetical protein
MALDTEQGERLTSNLQTGKSTFGKPALSEDRFFRDGA